MSSLGRTWLDAFRANGSETKLDRYLVGLPVFKSLQSATETVQLAGKVIKITVTRPASVMRESIIEGSKIFRVSWAPMAFGSLVYVLAFGSVLFARIVTALGAPDRLGPGFYIGLLRELSTWLTFMILAAVVGAALAGDLGARRVREELDALEVLGVDTIRTLIVPRVVAITIAGVVLSILVQLVDLVCMMLLDTATVHLNFWTQVESVILIMNPYDLIAALIKHTILGFFIGIVACQRGLSARGGAEGVGRVVAETVIITFFGIWLINSLFNTGYLTVVPDALGIKG
jgi:phospholipid/cholesterol/gamma-HCH transport system permease protein